MRKTHLSYRLCELCPLTTEVADDIMAAVVKADEGQLKSILALEVSFNETLRYFQEQVG